MGFIVNAGASSPQVYDHQVIKVAKGDTLWEIASIYSRNSDIREYIYNIKKLNDLSGDTIYAGQVLLLP
ncbi:MAG: LysM peptidoglycan-binding domain-containing protein [Clostridiaceae bacterium]|nr:LysM peptidoglycan-binding domain-containing protein [Clostridiaceae bacterium]